MFEDSDYPQMLEDIMGNLYRSDDLDTNAYNYQYHYKELLDCNYLDAYLYRLTEDRLDREGLDYWGNKPEDKSQTEIAIEAMQAQIEAWEQSQRSQNG